MVIFKILGIGLFGVAGLVLVILFMPWATDPAIDCLDNGGVWDGAAARCRCDCLTWNEEDGCVPLPEGTGANPGCMRLYGASASARGTCVRLSFVTWDRARGLRVPAAPATVVH